MDKNLLEHKEKQLERNISLTTAIIAVFLAISSILGNSAGDDQMLYNSKASNNWSHYQSKSIKQNLFETNKVILSIELKKQGNSEELKKDIKNQLDFFEKEITRYDKEKQDISVEAKANEKASLNAGKQADIFDLAEGFYQISIIIAAIAIIAKNSKMWYMSSFLGLMAIVVSVYAVIA